MGSSKVGDVTTPSGLVVGRFLGHFPLDEASRTISLANISCGILVTWLNNRSWNLSIWRKRGSTLRNLRMSQLRTLSRSVTPWRKCNLCRLHLRYYSFNHCPVFLTVGEIRKKHRFINWQLNGVWKLPFCDHGAIYLM